MLLPERTRYYDKGSYTAPAFLALDPPKGAEIGKLRREGRLECEKRTFRLL